MKKARVLIVEDSSVVRELLAAIISDDPRLEVAGAVGSAEEALRKIDRLAPDVISLDIRLPGMNGLEATRRIMTDRPTPIVVVAASVQSDDLNITMNALRCGALAVVEKPAGVESSGFQEVAGNIRTQLYIMSQVRVVRQRNLVFASSTGHPSTTPTVVSPDRGNLRILAIACSTGGPNALAVVLRDLPRDLPCPILLVQHLPPSFISSFAAWIEGICPFQVQLVERSAPLMAGRIYLAGPNTHLTASRYQAVACAEPPVRGQRPSATVLFRSVALEFGASAIGVIMTGMGDDGADGLLEMRRAGAYTIAEDKSTAIVFGMPAAAVEAGAVCESLPLLRISSRLNELTQETRRV